MTKVELSYADFKNNANEICDLVADHLRTYQGDDEVWRFMVVPFKDLKRAEKRLNEDALILYVDLDLMGSSLSVLSNNFELIEDRSFKPAPLIGQGAIMVFTKD